MPPQGEDKKRRGQEAESKVRYETQIEILGKNSLLLTEIFDETLNAAHATSSNTGEDR